MINLSYWYNLPWKTFVLWDLLLFVFWNGSYKISAALCANFPFVKAAITKYASSCKLVAA